VNCATPEEPFKDNVLGEGNIAVFVLDVFGRNTHDIMSHRQWPIGECRFVRGCSQDETMQHFSKILHPMDFDAH
jgi:hypothetical protein